MDELAILKRLRSAETRLAHLQIISVPLLTKKAKQWDYLASGAFDALCTAVLTWARGRMRGIGFRIRKIRSTVAGSPIVNYHSNLALRPSISDSVEPPEDVSKLRLVAISDTFTAAGLCGTCDVEFLQPSGWKTVIERKRPHFLFVESAWQGLNGEWRELNDARLGDLERVVDYCRKLGIPTVFWNKEDPVHYDEFLPVAALFDFVCTTDADRLDDYRKALGHKQIYVMPFSLDPSMHHPIANAGERRREAAFFAGAWYANHVERCEDFINVAEAMRLAGEFDIYDRASSDESGRFSYPSRYAQHVLPAVEYQSTPALYRGYRIGVSINTVTESPTMFARRAVELLGTGTSVYSNPSLALRNIFGDLIHSPSNPDDILEAAYAELRNPLGTFFRYRRMLGIRKVLAEYTWRQQLLKLSNKIFGSPISEVRPQVTVVARVGCVEEVDLLKKFAGAQRGVDCSLHILGVGTESAGISRICEEQLSRPMGDVFGPETMVAPWCPDDHYGPFYLHDLCRAMEFSQGVVIGKACYWRYDKQGIELRGADDEYRQVESLALRRCLFPAGHWQGTLGELLMKIDSDVINGERMISVDGFSYLENGARRALPEEGECISTGCSLADLNI